jgi:importin-9
LPALLKAVAARLLTAEAHNLIQGLIVVFARLIIKQPKDVIDFLVNTSIGHANGLEVVLKAWLENSNVFSGYADIKQKCAIISFFPFDLTNKAV